MSLLTVVCLEGSREKFNDNNKFLIDTIGRKNDQIDICINTEFDCPEKTAYERFVQSIEESNAKYICFVNASTRFRKKQFDNILKNIDAGAELFYSMKLEDDEGTGCKAIVELSCPLFLPRYIIRRDFLKEIQISPGSEKYFRECILLALAKQKSLPLLEYKLDCTEDEYLETRIAKYYKAFDKDWYIPEAENFIIPQLQGQCSEEEQELLLYMVFLKLFCNRGVYNKKILEQDELVRFGGLVRNALSLIDSSIFFNKRSVRKYKMVYCQYLYKMRDDNTINLEYVTAPGKQHGYYFNGRYVAKNLLYAYIYAINIVNDAIIIDFLIHNDYFNILDDGLISVNANNRNWGFEKTGITTGIDIFGEESLAMSLAKVTVPLDAAKDNKINFVCCLDNNRINLPIRFKRTAARLTEKTDNSYCLLDGYLLKYHKNALTVSHKTDKRSIARLEYQYEKSVLKTSEEKKEAFDIVRLRRLYQAKLYKPEKPVWIFFDKLYKGGDNGEHLFKYAYENVDFAESYYIIKKDTDAYKELSAKYGKHILPFKSTRQRLMVLYADIIFATHASVPKFCGFEGTFLVNLRDLFKAKVVCIQHGLTIQDIQKRQNRLIDNTRAYFCAAQMEIDNLTQAMYGYDSDQLHLTGLPRYDGLSSNDKRQILLAPTWRRDIVISGNEVGTTKEYNPRFKESEYFHVYDKFIHNRKLINCAEEHGYKLIFLLHPTIGVQERDFDKNLSNNVKIVNGANASYEEFLSESSLLITDYSGIQFDFAYMKKPVIYYHPDELPPQYENSHFSYENNGFGPIVDKHEQLVGMICEYMENGCNMKSSYIDRVEEFFKYDDNNNCKRICDTIKDLYY